MKRHKPPHCHWQLVLPLSPQGTISKILVVLFVIQLLATCNSIGVEASMQVSDESHMAHFTCGKLYYRTLHLDQQRNLLLVGAMDNIFQVNLANVNKTNCLDDAIRLEAQPADIQKCTTKGKSENFDCRNHIKVIQPLGAVGQRHQHQHQASDSVYVCGTGAYSPRHQLISLSNLSTSQEQLPGWPGQHSPAPGECPFDPDDNSTAVWVPSGNPSDLPGLYTGTVLDASKTDWLIFRTELHNQSTGQKVHEAKRTQRFEPRVLDKPNFVGSFEIGDYVYFFFRESAYEFINCGKSIYSRVARVCKRDNGYKHMHEKFWTTYLKARLNCSIPGEFPYYFDEIQHIYRNPLDDTKFHAVFTTSSNGLAGSAICTFTLDSITEAFNGKFKEQKSSDSVWLPVPQFKLNQNEPRPGTCVQDSLSLSDHQTTFIRSHPLMDSAVANEHGKPIFYRRDLLFTRLAVDVIQIDGVKYTVYFVGTTTGHVYKIVEWMPATSSFPPTAQDAQSLSGNREDGGSSWWSQQQQQQHQLQPQSTLVEIIEATVPEPVRAMEISAQHKSLYVSSDSQIRQINLLQCRQRHDNCLQCVRDPYCGWDRKHQECRHFTPTDPSLANALMQDVTGEMPDMCHAAIKHRDVHVTWGQSVHLPCRFAGFIQESQDLQQLLVAQQRHQRQQLRATYGDLAAAQALLQASSPERGAQTLNNHLVHPANYIQWYYHKRDTSLAPGYPVLERRDKFVLATDQGLVILNANEPGWYQCRLGNQIIYSYNLIIDTKTCQAPGEAEFKRIYADWCREMERYKSAYRNWHAKQNRCHQAPPGATGNQLANHQQAASPTLDQDHRWAMQTG